MLVNIQRTIHIPTRMLASLRPLPSGMPHYISKDHALNTANMKGTFPRSQRLFHLLLLIKLRKSLQFTSCSVNVFGETPSFLRAQTQRTALRGEYITFLPCLVANCRANSADCAGSLQCISFLQVFAWGSSLLLHKNDTLWIIINWWHFLINVFTESNFSGQCLVQISTSSGISTLDCKKKIFYFQMLLLVMKVSLC